MLRLLPLLSAMCLLLLLANVGYAFPEYEAFIKQHSGRPMNCGMCHVNPDGPLGTGEAQLGRLTPQEMERVNQARAATEPGQQVNSPILNAFGNSIVEKVGTRAFVAMGADPGKLPSVYGMQSDLDGDGIPDAQEFLDGTNPLDKNHGAPWRLFTINLRRQMSQNLLALVILGLAFFGLTSLVRSLRSPQV